MLPTKNQARTTARINLSSTIVRMSVVIVSLLILVSIVAGGVLPLWAQSAPLVLPSTGVVITEDSRLNMRQGPGIDFPLVVKLDPQTEVTIVGISDDGGWYEIEVDGVGSGWVAAEWIQVGGASQDDVGDDDNLVILVPTPTPGTAPTDDALDSQEELPAPPRMGIAALIAPRAVTATVEAIEPTLVITSSVTTTAEPSEEEPLVIATASPASESTADELTVGESAVTTATTEADIVSIVAVDAVTTPVDTAEPTAATTSEPTATSTPATPEPDVPTAITQPTRMNVRGGPGTNFSVVAGVDANTALVILGTNPDRDWYRVELAGLADGEQAWVFAGLTTVVGPADEIEVVAEEDLPVAPTPEPQAAQAQAVAAPVVAAPPPAGGGFFGYGVQAHMLGGGAGAALNATGDLGFNWIKQQVEWRLFQPSPGAIGFGELGGIVSAAGQRNINVLFSVVNAPEWAREPGFDGSVGGPPADPNTYAAFVGRMAGDFCGTALKAIEIWNEQNLHYEWGNKPLDPAEYMNLLRAAYGSIKAACPEMLVISGALTPAGSNPPFAIDDFAYLEGMYQNGLAAVSDGIGAHPSGYNVPASVGFEQACGVIQQTGNLFNGACDTPHHSWSFRSTMEGYRNIMVVYGDANKRIWPTEFGWAAGGAFDPRYAYANDNSFDEQAAWTVEAYTMMRNWGWVGPAFLWNLNFRVVADGTEKAQWGIVGNDYSPLPVYQALQAMSK